jgi:hypothetical protein
LRRGAVESSAARCADRFVDFAHEGAAPSPPEGGDGAVELKPGAATAAPGSTTGPKAERLGRVLVIPWFR